MYVEAIFAVARIQVSDQCEAFFAICQDWFWMCAKYIGFSHFHVRN